MYYDVDLVITFAQSDGSTWRTACTLWLCNYYII